MCVTNMCSQAMVSVCKNMELLLFHALHGCPFLGSTLKEFLGIEFDCWSSAVVFSFLFMQCPWLFNGLAWLPVSVKMGSILKVMLWWTRVGFRTLCHAPSRFCPVGTHSRNLHYVVDIWNGFPVSTDCGSCLKSGRMIISHPRCGRFEDVRGRAYFHPFPLVFL